MRLQDVMSTKIKTIKPGASADAAWERMKNGEIRHLVVVDNAKVVGVISERDLGGARGVVLRKGKSVDDLMSGQVLSAKPTDTLRQAANKLRGYGIGCLPIMQDGKLKGMLTVTDLLELIGRGVERPEQRTKRATRKRMQGGHTPYRRV